MKRSNNTILWVIVGVVVLGCCGLMVIFGGSIFMVANRGMADMKEAQTQGDTYLKELTQPWNASSFQKYADPAAREYFSEQAAKPLVEKMRPIYGDLKAFTSKTTGFYMHTSTSEGTYTQVNYTADAEFALKRGEIKMILRKREGKWGIYQFEVNPKP